MDVPRIILHYEILSRIAIYAGLSSPRSEASSGATRSDTTDSRSALCPMDLMKLYAKCPSATERKSPITPVYLVADEWIQWSWKVLWKRT